MNRIYGMILEVYHINNMFFYEPENARPLNGRALIFMFVYVVGMICKALFYVLDVLHGVSNKILEISV